MLSRFTRELRQLKFPEAFDCDLSKQSTAGIFSQ